MTTPYTYNPQQVSAFSSKEEAIKTLDQSYKPPAPPTPPPGSPASEPSIFRYTGSDPALNFMGSRFETPPAAFTESDAERIREDFRRKSQAEIDAINREFDILRRGEERAGEGRQGQLRAIQARGGTTESPMGLSQKTKTDEYTQENIRLLGEQKAQKISAIFNRIEDKADEEIKMRKLEAEGNAKDYVTFLSGVRDETREDIKMLARTGARLENLEKDKLEQYMKLGGFDSVEALQMYIDDNKANAEKPDWFFQEIVRGADGKAFYKQVGLDPITGEKIDRSTPLGVDYSSLQDAKTQVIDGVLHEQQEDGSWKPVAGKGITTPGDGPIGGIKFTQDDTQRLASAGLSQTEIKGIESDINQFGLDETVKGLPENQQKIVREVLGGEDNRQFLTKDYFKGLFTTTQLKNAASEAGYNAGGFLGYGTGDKGIEDYLTHLEGLVTQYRNAGYSDQEILKLMNK